MIIAELRDELSTACAIHRLIKQKERPDLVALSIFNTRDWRSLSLTQLKQIHAILLARRARRQRALAAAKQQLRLL